LIKALIKATTEPGDLIVDPCAGSFVVLEVCQELAREFMGCDLTYLAVEEFKRERERERESRIRKNKFDYSAESE